MQPKFTIEMGAKVKDRITGFTAGKEPMKTYAYFQSFNLVREFRGTHMTVGHGFPTVKIMNKRELVAVIHLNACDYVVDTDAAPAKPKVVNAGQNLPSLSPA